MNGWGEGHYYIVQILSTFRKSLAVKTEKLLHIEEGGGRGRRVGKKSTDRASVTLLSSHRQYLQDKNCVLIIQLTYTPSIKPIVY